jgi:hypothetical protein
MSARAPHLEPTETLDARFGEALDGLLERGPVDYILADNRSYYCRYRDELGADALVFEAIVEDHYRQRWTTAQLEAVEVADLLRTAEVHMPVAREDGDSG